MTTHLQVGDHFPDVTLPDQRGVHTQLGFTDGYPLILIFGRGFFCPRDQQQFRQLVTFQEELAVNYCKLATVSADAPLVSAAFWAGLGARWPFLCDEERGD